MKGKTLFIIIITALLTTVLLNNNDEMPFWLFGTVNVSKLPVMGGLLLLGFILGFMARNTKKKSITSELEPNHVALDEPYLKDEKTGLSKEDRDYIS